MYLDHFGLKEWPFGITPDVDFTYQAPSHEEALTTLRMALATGEGFVKVTGEVGTGKTLLCRTLLERLAGQAVTAYLPHPHLPPRAMLRALASELRLKVPRQGQGQDMEHTLYAAVQDGLLKLARAGQPVVLCIDEAQALPPDTLEALRLLSNLETGKRKLLQIVLFGQPELDNLLAGPAFRSLVSRLAFTAHLSPLGREDFMHYLRHRLVVAGWRGHEVFGPAARTLLWWASGGVPRKANILAHKCLMLAYGEGRHDVTWNHAWSARRDTAQRLRPAHAPLPTPAHQAALDRAEEIAR
jgi:MSHA biogenesis protein MshM